MDVNFFGNFFVTGIKCYTLLERKFFRLHHIFKPDFNVHLDRNYGQERENCTFFKNQSCFFTRVLDEEIFTRE